MKIFDFLKKIITALLFILFVIICLFFILLNSNSVIGATYGVNGSAIPSTVISNLVDYYEANFASTYDNFTITYKPSDSYGIINFFNFSDSSTRIVFLTDHCESTTGTLTGVFYSFNKANGDVWDYKGRINYYMVNSMSFDGDKPYYYSNLDLETWDGETLWATDYNVSTPPSIINTTTQAYQDNLVNGSFENIIISAGEFAEYPIRFWINNGSTTLDNERLLSLTLDSNSPYADVSIEPNQYQQWTIPKSDLIPIYNNSYYNMWLQYGENFSYSTSVYSWQTNFSQSTIDNNIIDAQDAAQQTADNTQQIASELNQTNQFLTNDTIDDDDIDLPEISANDFTLSFFSSLIGSITDAFLDTTSDEVIEFDVRGTHYVIHSTQFNVLSSAGLGVLKNFVSLFWVFSIGYYIFCDARKRIAKLKQFNWTAMFADDISVDML